MRILISEKIAGDSVEYLRQQGFVVDELLGLSQPEIEAAIAPYDALIVRSVTQVNRSLLEKGVNLKVVGRAGNGIDNIDVPACTAKGIIAVNTPEANIMAAGLWRFMPAGLTRWVVCSTVVVAPYLYLARLLAGGKQVGKRVYRYAD